MPPQNSSSHSSSGQSPFRSYPQKFPKAQAAAKNAVNAMFRLVQKGPRSQPAQVVDASFHLSQGSVLATTNGTIVRVYGVPYGTVVNGMRLFIRPIGSLVTNQAYIFDGYAPNLSGLGSAGSILLAQPNTSGAAVAPAITAASGFVAVTGISSAVGYVWFLFFYLPQLPSATVTLFQQSQVSGTNVVQLEYLPTGFLQFRSQDGHGYITTTTVPPHNSHFVVIQPGVTSNEFLVDGIASYTGLIGGSDTPTFGGNTNTYTTSWLSTTTGTNLCPLGSWVSKMGYGISYSSGALALPTLNTAGLIPAQDSDVPVFNSGTNQRTLNTYLCEDAQVTPPTAQTLANGSASWGSAAPASTITLNSQAVLQVPGPY